MVKYAFYIIIILIIFVSALSIFNKNKDTSLINPRLPSDFSDIKRDVSPTPFPFMEMTIPYLRSRTYESTLGELEKISENSQYITYLTSYGSDGLKVNGQLTIPKGDIQTGGWPAIIFIHGYIPPAQYQTLVNYVSYVDFIARNGFVVFKIDLRGHADSEGEASGAYYSSDYIIDTLNAYAALEKAEFVNQEKIGLWGHSMAGNVVLRSLAAKPQIPAAVIWAGAVYSYSDMQKYGINDGSYRPPAGNSERQRKRQQLRETHGDFNESNEFWRKVSPIFFLNDLKGNIQINHAVDDNVVSIGFSRDLAKQLEKARVDFELKEYQSGGHNLIGSTFTAAMQNTVDFYRNQFSSK